jgi:uncharacterized membrane protein
VVIVSTTLTGICYDLEFIFYVKGSIFWYTTGCILLSLVVLCNMLSLFMIAKCFRDVEKTVQAVNAKVDQCMQWMHLFAYLISVIALLLYIVA